MFTRNWKEFFYCIIFQGSEVFLGGTASEMRVAIIFKEQ